MSTPPTISAATDQSTPSQVAISNGVLLAAVIFLFMVVLFVFLLYLYAKRFLGANPMLNPSSPRFIFLADSPLPGRGLPAAVLRSLPVAVYSAPSPRAHKLDAPLECAVCLSEVAAGDKLRTLPKCGHRFHVDCIDMWFHSHDTCPLCRAPVGGAAADAEAGGGLPRVPREDPAGTLDLPTNVLFWGTHDDAHFTNTNANLIGMPPPPTNAASTTTSSSASGLRKDSQLVIDIPNRQGPIMMVLGASSPLRASRDDLRSPMSARLRSLRRLLSRGKQAVAGTSSSASPRDIEQGLAARPPKTPKTPPSSN